MTDDAFLDEESEKEIKKKQKIEREKKELLASLNGADFKNQRTKVAYILNLYPQARDSDIALTLMYWETFQSNIYNPNGILPKDLFKLERMHYIVRARAKIQNEYKLFLPKEEIRNLRKKNEEKMNDAVISDVVPRKLIYVYSDETGKTQNYILVASVWVLSGRSVYKVSQSIRNWQENSQWANREVHFAKFGRKDLKPLEEYLGVILTNREFLSFKVVAVEKAKTKRKIEDVVVQLHKYMLTRGTFHELDTRRIETPQRLKVNLDYEQSLDQFTLNDLVENVNSSFLKKYTTEDLMVESIETISSKNSELIQLADLIAGAINRKLNHTGERNFKDEMADLIIQMLDLSWNVDNVPDFDDSVLFKL